VFHTQKLIHIYELFMLSSFQCHCCGISAFLQHSTWLPACLTNWPLHHLFHLTLLQVLLPTQK